MSRYSRLERAVMEALAHDLIREIPDLAGQFEESRPGLRRNTGFGLFTEMIVDRSRPPPAAGPTGDLGTVHVMVGDLADPIAFRARVRNGVLLGVVGDSYGQDTRAIDFATVPFDQVFTVDERGRSIAFEPARLMPPSPLLDLQRHEDHLPEPAAAPSLRNIGALQRLQESAGPLSVIKVEPLPESGPVDASDASLRVGLWFGLFVIGSVLILLFGAPIPFVFVAAVIAGRVLQTERGLDLLRQGLAALHQAARDRRV